MIDLPHFFKKCGKSIKIRKKDGFAANPGLPQIRVCRKFTKMRQTRICGKPGFAANPDLRQIDVNPLSDMERDERFQNLKNSFLAKEIAEFNRHNKEFFADEDEE